MEKYVFDLIAFLVGTALVGLVALLVNGLKNELIEIKNKLDCLVTKEVCDAHREGMKKDIDSIGALVRNH